MEDGCRDCSQSTKNAFVWPLRSKPLHGVIFIDYFEKGRTLTRAYYAVLLDRLVRMKRPHLKKKKILFNYFNAPSYTSNIAQTKNMNWVSNRFLIHRIF